MNLHWLQGAALKNQYKDAGMNVCGQERESGKSDTEKYDLYWISQRAGLFVVPCSII